MAPVIPALKNHARFWSDIAMFGDYLPWNIHKGAGGDRSNYPQHSGRILDLKDGSDAAATYFADLIEPELNDDVVIAVVPSHQPNKVGGGLSKLAAGLSKKGKNRVDGSSALVRTKKISKLAHGGDRSIEVHMDSVTVAIEHGVAYPVDDLRSRHQDPLRFPP